MIRAALGRRRLFSFVGRVEQSSYCKNSRIWSARLERRGKEWVMRGMPQSNAISALGIGLFVSDFDDTLSEGDTIGIIFKAAAEAARITAGDGAAERRQTIARNLADNYAAKYGAFMTHHGLQVAAAERVQQEELRGFLSRLSEFDRDMVKVVEDAGILAGLSKADLEEAGRANIRLKAGAVQTLKKAGESGSAVHILSVNWSTSLIKAALQHSAAGGLELPPLQIHANELCYDSGESTGKIEKHVVCAEDKLQVFQELRKLREEGLSIMCGDSLSDLACLLEADIGIVLGANKQLQKTAATAGINLLPLSGSRQLDLPPKCLLVAVESR